MEKRYFTKKGLKIYKSRDISTLPKIFYSGSAALLQYLNSNTEPGLNHRYEIIDETLDKEVKCDKS